MVDSQYPDCVYTVNRRSRFVSVHVLRVAFEDVTLTQYNFYCIMRYSHAFVTCAYVHLGANCGIIVVENFPQIIQIQSGTVCTLDPNLSGSALSWRVASPTALLVTKFINVNKHYGFALIYRLACACKGLAIISHSTAAGFFHGLLANFVIHWVHCLNFTRDFD